MRQVIILSPKGQKRTVLQSDAVIFNDLLTEMQNQNIDTKSMKFIIGETQHTLESKNATLPTGNFTLFLTPTTSKSGADWSNAPYKECKAKIKELRANYDEAEAWFGDYTHKTTEQLRDDLVEWFNKYEDESSENENITDNISSPLENTSTHVFEEGSLKVTIEFKNTQLDESQYKKIAESIYEGLDYLRKGKYRRPE